MKILVVTKRQYTGQDLIDDRYGRLYELPEELRRLGNDVYGVCFSYRARIKGLVLGQNESSETVKWFSWNTGFLFLPGFISGILRMNSLLKEIEPDVIMASSDIVHLLVGRYFSSRYKTRLIVDLYDNYESFKLTKLIGMRHQLRKIVQMADGVVCVSRSLAEYVSKHYQPRGAVAIVENGFSPSLFRPMNRYECRKRMGLKANAKIIGTAGALSDSRGIRDLFDAFKQLKRCGHKELYLALAGPLDEGISLPDDTNVKYFGRLAHEDVPVFLNCLDVGVVCNRKSDFGKFCYPMKAIEMLACGIPIVGANTSDMKDIVNNDQDSVFEPGSVDSLCECIRQKLYRYKPQYNQPDSWEKKALELNSFIRNQILALP